MLVLSASSGYRGGLTKVCEETDSEFSHRPPPHSIGQGIVSESAKNVGMVVEVLWVSSTRRNNNNAFDL